MRLTLFGDVPRAEPNGEVTWDVGAAVLRSRPGGSVYLEFGPADGAVQVRLALGPEESQRLEAGLRRVNQDGGETVVMA